MIMAIMIIVALSVTITALLTTVDGGLRLARVDQDRTTAFQHANAGVDHVLYRLDQSGGRRHETYLPGQSETGANARYTVLSCTGGEAPPCTTNVAEFTDFVPPSAADPMKYIVYAKVDPPGQTNRWLVSSTGCDPLGADANKCVRQRKAVARIQAQLLFQDGFFTFDGFDLTGTQATPVVYCSRPCPPTFATGHPVQYTDKTTTHTSDCVGVPVPSDTNPPCSINRAEANFGTNGTLTGSAQTITAFAQLWQGFNMYGRATQLEAEQACGGTAPNSSGQGLCTQAGAVVRHFTDQLTSVTPRVPPRPRGCPNGGIVTGTIAPGDYLCETLTFKDNVVISGTGNARFWVRCRLYFSGTSTAQPREINKNQPPIRLQIYFDQPTCPGANDSNLCDTVLFAMLYAPGLTISCSGQHQSYVYGAVVARFYQGTGNQFQFFWDLSSAYDLSTGKFRVFDWRECPVATAVEAC